MAPGPLNKELAAVADLYCFPRCAECSLPFFAPAGDPWHVLLQLSQGESASFFELVQLPAFHVLLKVSPKRRYTTCTGFRVLARCQCLEQARRSRLHVGACNVAFKFRWPYTTNALAITRNGISRHQWSNTIGGMCWYVRCVFLAYTEYCQRVCNKMCAVQIYPTSPLGDRWFRSSSW